MSQLCKILGKISKPNESNNDSLLDMKYYFIGCDDWVK